MNNNLKEILSCILIVCTVNLIVNLSFVKDVKANNNEQEININAIVVNKATPILIASGGNPTPTPDPEPPFWYDCTTGCIIDALYYDVGPVAADCVAAVYSNVAVLIAMLVCVGGTGILGSIGCITAPAIAACGLNVSVSVNSSAYSCAFWCYWYS